MKKSKTNDLISDIISAQTELEVAKRNFQFVSNDKLIEMYAHKIIAARVKCDYLIQQAKSVGLINSFSLVQDKQFQRFQR